MVFTSQNVGIDLELLRNCYHPNNIGLHPQACLSKKWLLIKQKEEFIGFLLWITKKHMKMKFDKRDNFF